MTSITVFFLFIPFLALVLLAINLLFAPHNPYQEKNSVFECGYHSFLGQNRTQFTISFFIFALLFLLFDLEILLIYPYTVSSYTITIYGLVIMLIFFLVLTLGFQFELGKKALNIYSRQLNIIKYIYRIRVSKQSDLFLSIKLWINKLFSYFSCLPTILKRIIYMFTLLTLGWLLRNWLTYDHYILSDVLIYGGFISTFNIVVKSILKEIFNTNHMVMGGPENKVLKEIFKTNHMMEGEPKDKSLEDSWSTLDSSTEAPESSTNSQINKINAQIEEAKKEANSINKKYQKVLSKRDDAQDFDDKKTEDALEPEMLSLYDDLEEAKQKVRDLKKELKMLKKDK